MSGSREGGARSAPGGWERVKAVFLEALDLPDDRRRDFLARACGADDALRREVESLLASDRDARGFGEDPFTVLLESLAVPPPAPARLAPGARLGAYEIIGFIGAGGMGEVYRARDTRLDREVAVKTIPGGMPDALAKARLLEEARHASSLNHPNICTIHETGEAGGLPYIVMALAPGRSLKAICAAEPPGVRRAVGYLIQVAGAVAHAHARGIVHRDLKSSNIAVDDEGRVVVLDFGLARRLPDGAANPDSTQTAAQAPAGTLSYMAPEVLLGGRADARSDVWSMGVLLYEAISGRLPFEGRTPFETTSAIIGDRPRPLPRGVPVALRLVIERCLAKHPGRRYQRAGDVGAALRAIEGRRGWRVAGALLVPWRRTGRFAAAAAVLTAGVLAVADGPVPRPARGAAIDRVGTLAVLPFDAAEADGGDRHLAEGFADAIAARIGALGTVRVVSRSSAARAVRGGRGLREAGVALGADAIVHGGVRRVGDKVRVDLRLAETHGGRALWEDSYERPLREALVLQAEAVRAIALSLEGALPAGARERLAMVRTVNPEAYEEFLKGRYQWNRRTQASLQTAVAHFTRAAELDPTFAPAHAGLADCYNQFGTVMVGAGTPLTWRPRAEAAAVRALQIDPDSAEAHAALGYVRHYDWQWEEAEAAFRRAIQLNPSYAPARLWYANLLMSRRRLDEALREVSAARELDPFSLITNTNVGWVLIFARRPHDAVAQLTRTLELDPDYEQALSRLAGVLAELGRFDEALERAAHLARLRGDSPSALALLADLHAGAGRRGEAEALLRRLLAIERQQYVPPGAIAGIYIRLGDRDAAFHWIERAFEERSNYIAYLAVEPGHDPIRGDPRFAALLERAGLAGL